jgi:hypothetical protein
MSLKSSAIWTVLAVALVTAGPTRAEHSWNDYHWARTSSPFELRVVDSVTPAWQFAFDQSLIEWDRSSKLDNLVAAADDGARTRKRCRTVAGQMRVCNAAYGQNGWLGLASINLDANGHITQGYAKMNDSYDWYFAQNPGEDNHVMCQEIGHVYGLGHTSEDGSSQGTCMDYSSSLNSQWPNAHDYQQLDSIYAHLDSYNSYDDGSSGGDGDGGGGGCNAPPGKGCNKSGVPAGVPDGAIRVHHRPGRDGQLGHADFVLPDGRGGLWLWHVTLLPEDAQPR